MVSSDKKKLKKEMEKLPRTIKKRELLEWFMNLKVKFVNEISIADIVTLAEKEGITIEKDTKEDMIRWVRSLNLVDNREELYENGTLNLEEKEMFIRLHHKEGKSIREIAKILERNYTTIFYKFGKYDIRVRKAKKLKAPVEDVKRFLEEGFNRNEIAEKLKVSRTLIDMRAKQIKEGI